MGRVPALPQLFGNENFSLSDPRTLKKWIIPLNLIQSTSVFLPLVCNPQAGCSGSVNGSSVTVLSEVCREQQGWHLKTSGVFVLFSHFSKL